MPLSARLRGAVRAAFRTRRRAALTAVALAVLGLLGWQGARLYRARAAVARAEAALARYDFPAAREHLRFAADLRPGRPTAWLLAAQAARRDGDLAAAKDHLYRYKALAGATPDGRLEEALQRVQKGEIEEDVYDLTTKADAGHPATEQILEALAVGSVQAYRFELVALWLQFLLDRYPKNPVGRMIRAQTDDLLGHRDRAAAGCRELLADFPDNDRARALLAGLLYRTQQYGEAADLYRDLRQRRPDDLAPLLGLTRCQERLGRADEVRALARDLEGRFADRGEALLEAGRFALADDRPGDAERLLRRAVELNPNDDEAHYQLGLCLERAGKADEAREHFERFRQVQADLARLDVLVKAAVTNPRDPAPRREAGLICLRNGQPSEALRWLQGATALAPGDPDTRAARAAVADYYKAQGGPAR